MTTCVCSECGAEFVPRYGSQVCCSDECKAARKKMLVANLNRSRDQKHEKAIRKERREKARRRAEFFAARDAAFERAGQPIPKIEERGGVRIENRGTIAWGGGTFSSNPSIRPAVNPSVLH